MPRRSREGFLIVVSIVFVTVILPILVTGFSSGPLDGKTGAPGEGLCVECHGIAIGDGSVAILGLPSNYTPSATYPITVRVEDPGQQRWGFELTALNAALEGSGSFTVTDALNTQLSAFAAPARSYIKHTSTGTRLGTANGPVDFNFNWTAPASDEGVITLFAAGNGANGNLASTGDYIYTANVSINPPVSGGCCGQFTGGQTGNTNCDPDGKRNLADITKLIDRVYISKALLCCEANGNVDGDVDAKLNLADITKLIDHVYISKVETAACI
jgi:hypothetical protein